ncbi:hypothetical protein PTTG_29760 [Puccinia triticina 1-1 BBBD Race 1]|uniref:Uncharacterized protein n=1 Tax=Puccinia triticina (isolate 1-1 / race 1 (BBBD)) TaxID=630390 RepID=A0A180G1Y9_PUCT1|nr:hypothetical protein PTTG_29760 [Puccinia triticina 1-1 BBBD Race 1]
MQTPVVENHVNVINDDDDVGFASESSGVHPPPTDHSEEFISLEVFGDHLGAITSEIEHPPQSKDQKKEDWSPFHKQEEFIACLILGFLHHIISRVAYIHIRTVLKTKQLVLPYWDAARRTKDRLRKDLNFITKQSISVWDNKVFHISVKGILANEMLNPYVTRHLEYYPHDPCGDPIDSLYQSFKWREDLPRDVRVQMVYKNFKKQVKHFYIYEPTRLISGQVVIPTFFYKAQGKLYAKCCVPEYETNKSGKGFKLIIPKDIKFSDSKQQVVDIMEFDEMYSEIKMENQSYLKAELNYSLSLTWISYLTNYMFIEENDNHKLTSIELPNPWRAKAKGCIIRHFPINLYADDTSGNCSKQWNKHISYYFTLSGLHPHWSNQEYNCHVVSMSNVASCLELADPILEEINEISNNGHFAYDSEINQKVLIMSIVLVALGDSPMHAEMTSTPMPANANSPCRMCQLSVAKKEDKSLVGYVKDFLRLTTGGIVPPPPRKWEDTISNMKKFWDESKNEAKTKYDDKTKENGLKDNINVEFVEQYHQRNKPGQKESIDALENAGSEQLFNRFYTLKGFDGGKDTPVEILHVLQLGLIQYLLRDFMEGLTEGDKRTVEANWQAFNKDSLNISSLRAVFMVNHYKSFIGKHMKIVIQAAPFVFFPLMNR